MTLTMRSSAMDAWRWRNAHRLWMRRHSVFRLRCESRGPVIARRPLRCFGTWGHSGEHSY